MDSIANRQRDLRRCPRLSGVRGLTLRQCPNASAAQRPELIYRTPTGVETGPATAGCVFQLMGFAKPLDAGIQNRRYFGSHEAPSTAMTLVPSPATSSSFQLRWTSGAAAMPDDLRLHT